MRLLIIAKKNIKGNESPDKLVRQNILKVVKRILPGSIYYAISGQLIIWLASFFANTTSIAQLGALGRISMLLSFFTVMIDILLVPRFARINRDRVLLLKRYSQTLAGVIPVTISLVVISIVFSKPILWVLGENYQGLDAELVLSIIAGALNLLAGMTFTLFTSRGWVLNPLINILINISTVIFGLIFYDISTLKGLLYLNITIFLTAFLINGFYCLYKILKIKDLNQI